MKILILGTSNSILANGWTYGLRDALKGHEIVNMSVGASPGVQFSDKMDLCFSQYDHVFFDSIPNDEEYASKAKGYIFDKRNERIIFEILSTIASQTSLIILGFCNKWAFNEESDIYKSRKSISKILGCQFIDIRSLLKVFLHGNAIDSVYEAHPAHPKREISFEIGRVIGNEILKSTLSLQPSAQNYSNNFTKELAASFGNDIIKLENRLLSMDVLNVDVNTELSANNNYACIGIYVNICRTDCILTYTDAHNSNHHVHMTYAHMAYAKNRPEGSFIKVFVPFYGAPKIKHISLNSMDVEGSHYYPVMTRAYNDTMNELHLSCLVYWDDKEHNQDYETRENVFHNINNLQLSYAVAHRLLEDTILSKHANLENKFNKIRTHHNTYILFDREHNKIFHGGTESIDNKTTPVVLVKNIGATTEVIRDEDSASVFDVFGDVTVHMCKKHITFMRDGKYLCARRAGGLTFSADKEKEWERFYLM